MLFLLDTLMRLFYGISEVHDLEILWTLPEKALIVPQVFYCLISSYSGRVRMHIRKESFHFF